MMKRVLAIGLMAWLGSSGSAAAGLRLTIRTETSFQGFKENPVVQEFLKDQMNGMLPEGPVETVLYIEKGNTRSESETDLWMLPRGTVTIRRQNEPVAYVLNPGQQTYFRMSAGQTSGPQSTGTVVVTPTDETDMIAGHKARKLVLAVNPAPGMAANLSPTLEVWATSDFSGVEDVASVVLRELLTAFGATVDDKTRQLLQFPLRIRFVAAIGALSTEMVSTVTAVDRLNVPDTMFVVPPPGYREVQPPAGNAFQMLGLPKPPY